MAEHYRFFDSADPLNPDRTYNADEFTEYFAALVTTGVMQGSGNELEVTASGDNMVSTVGTGIAFIEGKFYANDSPLGLTHETEALGVNRIDRVVIRLDSNTEARHVKAFIKKGTPAINPSPPALQRDGLIYEISLAQVYITGGQTYIDAGDVTDERENDDVCGWAGSNILPNFDDAALQDLIDSIGAPNGIATLDSDGNVPLSQLGPLEDHKNEKASETALGHVRVDGDTIQVSGTGVISADILGKIETVTKNWEVELGRDSNAAGDYSVAVGYNARTLGSQSVSIGRDAESASQNSVTIGYGASTSDVFGTAVGTGAEVLERFSSAFGQNAVADNDHIVVLGDADNDLVTAYGDFNVTGTKNFEIPHPHPDKKHTHKLRHAAVESPSAGENLYRYKVVANKENDVQYIDLPDYFIYLNKDVQVFVTPQGHFGNGYGKLNIETEQLEIHCQSEGEYNVLAIGTRNDDHPSVQGWDIKGAERENGESWLGETYAFTSDEIIEIEEFKEE